MDEGYIVGTLLAPSDTMCALWIPCTVVKSSEKVHYRVSQIGEGALAIPKHVFLLLLGQFRESRERGVPNCTRR